MFSVLADSESCVRVDADSDLRARVRRLLFFEIRSSSCGGCWRGSSSQHLQHFAVVARRIGGSLGVLAERHLGVLSKIIAVAKLDTKEHFSNSIESEKSGCPSSAAPSVGSEADCKDGEADSKDKNGIKESSPRCATALAASW